MSQEIVVIKLGGASLQEPNILEEFVRTVQGYLKYDYRVVVVHGGGPHINLELKRRNISWEFIDGQRKTTTEMMSVIEEVLFHKVNASLVLQLKENRIDSRGLSGASDKLLLCSCASAELGQVGKIEAVDIAPILEKMRASPQCVLVIAPLGVGENGEKYNINADWAASKIASALKAKKLIFLSDQDGILDSAQSLIPFVDVLGLKALLQSGAVSGGMYAKVLTIIDAIENRVEEVRVMRGTDAYKGLWSDYVGTFCSALQPKHLSYFPKTSTTNF